MARSFAVFALMSLVGATAQAAPRPIPQPACIAPPVGKIPFHSGERLEYALDTLGANIGGFNLSLRSGRRPHAWTVIAEGRTENLAGSILPAQGTAEANLDKDLETRRYVEDGVQGKNHWSLEVSLPSKDERLAVHATKQGAKDDYTTLALPDTRDLLGALYAVRAMELADNVPFCMPVFGARRVWRLQAKVVGHESIHTPMGAFATAHLVGTATRVDFPQQSRSVELWLTDDASRIPVAALGLMQNRVIRAQLSRYDAGRKPATHGDRPR